MIWPGPVGALTGLDVSNQVDGHGRYAAHVDDGGSSLHGWCPPSSRIESVRSAEPSPQTDLDDSHRADSTIVGSL